ncbi:MAG: low molecular weight phosphotyrosine protein phosphatase, partial [Bacteroidaceae bacterium]|nr:low molecular weight phosphotyrosine protein phosphatase [Bacteroidaceae bacterium]
MKKILFVCHGNICRKLAEHGISCAGKTARQLTQRDYQYYDHLIAMDQNNIRNMMHMLGG